MSSSLYKTIMANGYFFIKLKTFPERPISQKETHEDFFKNFGAELFGGEAYPNIFF